MVLRKLHGTLIFHAGRCLSHVVRCSLERNTVEATLPRETDEYRTPWMHPNNLVDLGSYSCLVACSQWEYRQWAPDKYSYARVSYGVWENTRQNTSFNPSNSLKRPWRGFSRFAEARLVVAWRGLRSNIAIALNPGLSWPRLAVRGNASKLHKRDH